MDLKKGLLISIIINLGLLVMIFVVKHNVTAQAQTQVKTMVGLVRQQNEIFANNTLLWGLVAEAYKSSDHSLVTFTKLAKDKRLPGRKDEKAFLQFETVKQNGLNARRVGWEKYSIMATFDAKDNLVDINVDDLLGKETPVNGAASEAPADSAK